MIATHGTARPRPANRLFGRRGQPRRVLGCLGRNPRPDHASPASASLGHGVARLAADSSPGARIDIAINGESAGVYPIGGGSFACRVRPSRHLRDTFSVSWRRAAALTGPRLPVRDRSWFEAALFPPRSDGSRPFPPSRERRHSNSAPRAPIRPGWRRAFRSPRG